MVEFAMNPICGALSDEHTAPHYKLHNSTVFLSVFHSFSVLFSLTYSLLSSPFASVCFYFFSQYPLSLGSAWVSLLNPPYQHVWLMKKGNVCRNSIILTCWWQRGGGGAGEKETEKGRKKTVPQQNATHRSAISSPVNKRRDYSL